MHMHTYTDLTNTGAKTVGDCRERMETNESVMEGDFAPKVAKELHFFLIYTWIPIYPRGSRSWKKEQRNDSFYVLLSLLRLSELIYLTLQVSQYPEMREEQ